MYFKRLIYLYNMKEFLYKRCELLNHNSPKELMKIQYRCLTLTLTVELHYWIVFINSVLKNDI